MAPTTSLLSRSYEPTLEKPGAGLPLIERIVARYWILPRGVRAQTWDQNVETFIREGRKALELVLAAPKSLQERRVLIDRLPGMEDSSRFWSIAMTLEHLVIVGQSMGEVIISLSKGVEVQRKVGIADVKPLGKMTSEESITQFEKLLKMLPERLRVEVQDRGSRTRHVHPWFGPLTARQWTWVLGVHQAIHRRQIQSILRIANAEKEQS